jgi:hypothetical protein
MAKDVALTKASVSVLGKGRVVRNPPIQAEPTKPAIRQIEMNFLAQSALGSNAHAIADDQHADHQFRVNRRATGAAVERLQRPPDDVKDEMPVDLAQQVIGGDMLIEAEIIE